MSPTTSRFVKILFSLSLVILSLHAGADEESKVNFSADLYGSHTNLMPFKGYQNDLSATGYVQYSDVPVLIFARYLSTNYYYLNDTVIGNTNYTSDHRTAAGLGLDVKLNDYVIFRIINEQINNKLADQNFNQTSYGLIYNQFIDLKAFELNNYLEAFYIPRISEKMDTYFRIQALKGFYLSQSDTSSNVIYPFAQIKSKYNDDSIFGITGYNLSFGGGYKYFKKENENKFSFIIEAHSVVHQSRDFNGDWLQAFAAIQWFIN